MTQLLEPLLATEVLLPVLDAGFVESFQPVIRAVSQRTRTSDLMRASGLPMVPRPHAEHMGEMFYCPSKYSALIQLTDMVSGLRRVLETERVSGSSHGSPYKRRLAGIAASLDPVVLFEHLYIIPTERETGEPVA
jgi:hypothetical protein